MNRGITRILIALILSTAGAYGTWYWYISTSPPKRVVNDRDPIGRIVYLNNEVQRKNMKRIIWEGVALNEPLFPGEAVRTSKEAEARIEITKTGASIDLEPESVIVLEENNGQVGLDFVKGNLFVNSVGKDGGAGLTVTAGNKTVALNNSELALGRDATGKVDVQVLRGKASVAGEGKTTVLENGKSLSGASLFLKSPSSNEKLYIDPTIKEKVSFEWQPLPPGFDVVLESGKSRKTLTRHSEKIPGESGRLAAHLPLGRQYWRLIALPKSGEGATIRSALFRNEILGKIPPQLLEPLQGETVVLTPEDPEVLFRWANPANVQRLTLELSATADFKTPLARKSLSDLGHQPMKFTKPGAIFWRVTGFLQGGNIPLSSEVRFAKIQIQKEVPGPILKLPLDSLRLSESEYLESGLTLSWEPVRGASKYQVTLKPKYSKRGEGAQVLEVNVPFLSSRGLPSGDWFWSVTAKSPKGNTSKPSEVRTFSIQDVPFLAWKEDEAVFSYYTKTPSVDASWERGPETAVRWRARVFGKGSKETGFMNFNEPRLSVSVPKEGDYVLEAEALDKKGQLVGRTKQRVVSVQAKPILPPPKFLDSVPNEIKADGRGNFAVEWEGVGGAKDYVVIVRTPAGAIVRQAKTPTTQKEIPRLMPGLFSVSLQAVDARGRLGQEGPPRNLNVPNRSNVKAPKIRRLKVE